MSESSVNSIESVRKRPGMYVGDARGGSGLHHLLWEVVSNALDEHLAGRATRIDVTCNEDGSMTVDDDGTGFPVHLVEGIPFAQRALTMFHGTATLDGHAPHAHVGLHGVGIFVVNALSGSLVLDVFRDGTHYRQRYAAGVPVTSLETVEATTRRGTTVTFSPDQAIFENTEMSFDVITRRLREIALLNAGLAVEVRDDRRRRHSYRHPEGVRGFLRNASDALTCSGVADGVRVDVALRWPRSRWDRVPVQSFANNEATTEHGTHVDGLLQGVVAAVVPGAKSTARVRDALTHDLEAVVSVNLADPTYADPAKDRLATPAVTKAVRTVVAKQLALSLAERPELRAQLVERLEAMG